MVCHLLHLLEDILTSSSLSSTYEAWLLSMQGTHGTWMPSPTAFSSLEDPMRIVSHHHYDSKGSSAFAIALVPNFKLGPENGQIIWEGCGVGWTLDDFERSSGSTGKTRDHQYYSMLQDSWIPNHGIELFLLFLAHLTRRWLNLCDQFEEHLSRLVSQHEKDERLIRLIIMGSAMNS
jgi:hypothetical protein